MLAHCNGTLYIQLKGCEKKNMKAEVDEMIRVLGLEAKRNALSSTLSGGQKRKLSVGIALIAGSKVLYNPFYEICLVVMNNLLV